MCLKEFLKKEGIPPCLPLLKHLKNEKRGLTSTNKSFSFLSFHPPYSQVTSPATGLLVQGSIIPAPGPALAQEPSEGLFGVHMWLVLGKGTFTWGGVRSALSV